MCLAAGLVNGAPVHQICGAVGAPLCPTCNTYATRLLSKARSLGLALPLQSTNDARIASAQHRAAPPSNFSFGSVGVGITRGDLAKAAK